MEKKESFFRKIKDRIEEVLPMNIGTFLLFIFLLYLIFIVCRVVVLNYESNKSIDVESAKVDELRSEIVYLQDQINYFQTYSYKEKEAREKLGYIAPGESIISLPTDTKEDSVVDTGNVEAKIKTPNYSLWWRYFFDN